jgi:hypothetical protein
LACMPFSFLKLIEMSNEIALCYVIIELYILFLVLNRTET